MSKSPRRVVLRLILWSLPVIMVALLSAEIRQAEHDAVVVQVGSLLVEGRWEAAHRLLRESLDHPALDNPQVAALSTVLGTSEQPEDLGDHAVDTAAVPLPLMVRTAFERGEFERARQLMAVSETFGQPTVEALEMALAIEAGQSVEAPSKWPEDTAESRLLDRLEGFAKTPELAGQVVRDRYGHPIATFEHSELRLLDGVRPQWIPRALETSIAEHGDAGSLRSSLDLELSAAAYGAFGRYYRGSIVIVDPQTGDVLAAVSDRRTYRQGGTPAFEQFREPASVSKLITAAATLRAGIDPDDAFRHMRCRGHERYAGEFLYCPHIVGPLRNLDRAMAVSCNVAFANLGVRLGRHAVLDELRAFGFGDTAKPLAGARILQPRGDDRQLADLSIGLDATEITPLHGALLAAVMANDGVMPTPRLLVSEDGRLGLHPRPLGEQAGRRVVEPEWVPALVSSMRAVAQRGTARNMAGTSFPVAMKTGTASHPLHGFHVNYVGIGPVPNARLAFCVRITDQPTSRKVRAAAREVTTRFLRSLGRIAEERGWNDGEGRDDYPGPMVSGRGESSSKSEESSTHRVGRR